MQMTPMAEANCLSCVSIERDRRRWSHHVGYPRKCSQSYIWTPWPACLVSPSKRESNLILAPLQQQGLASLLLGGARLLAETILTVQRMPVILWLQAISTSLSQMYKQVLGMKEGHPRFYDKMSLWNWILSQESADPDRYRAMKQQLEERDLLWNVDNDNRHPYLELEKASVTDLFETAKIGIESSYAAYEQELEAEVDLEKRMQIDEDICDQHAYDLTHLGWIEDIGSQQDSYALAASFMVLLIEDEV